MPQFLGRATIRANGQVIETARGASLDLGGVRRNPVTVGRLVGYAEETVPAMLECETALRPGVSLEFFRNLTGATVIFECDTGQRYLIADAFTSEPPTLRDGEGGQVSIRMAGPGAEEIL
jgi:hypothetical protein